MKMFKWQQTNKHVLSIYLKQNDSRASNFSKFWWQLFDIWATFGYIVKQLFLNLLAQSIHAYWWRETGEALFSSRAAALVSRVRRLRCSRARALLSLNLKKKTDCSQSINKIGWPRSGSPICLINLCNCVKKPEKNSGLQRGLNPWPRDTGAMLYQLSYEATDVGSRSIVGSYVPVKEVSVNDIWNKSSMNCGNEMKMKKWSSQRSQFMQLRKEAIGSNRFHCFTKGKKLTKLTFH